MGWGLSHSGLHFATVGLAANWLAADPARFEQYGGIMLDEYDSARVGVVYATLIERLLDMAHQRPATHPLRLVFASATPAPVGRILLERGAARTDVHQGRKEFYVE